MGVTLEESKYFLHLGIQPFPPELYVIYFTLILTSTTPFFQELDKCLARCEDAVETEDMFHSTSLFEHYKKLIGCRQRCRVSLTTGNTDTKSEKFVPLYYDFLQYAYFQGTVKPV